MNAQISIRVLIGALACLGTGGLVPAQSAGKPLTECFYSGAIGGPLIHSIDPPVRIEVDANGRGIKLIHNVQTNYDPNNPFKPAVLAEKATCRIKLDCVVAKDGLKTIGVLATNSGSASDNNVWVEVGTVVDFKYSDESRNVSCHVTGVELP